MGAEFVIEDIYIGAIEGGAQERTLGMGKESEGKESLPATPGGQRCAA